MPETRFINFEDAQAAAIDALSDLLHFFEGDEEALGSWLASGVPSAKRHYLSEAGTADAPYLDRERP